MVSVRNVFALATLALVGTVSAFEDDHRTLQAVNFRQEMLNEINAARKKEGLDELCINEMLMDAAQTQTNDMADNNFVKSTGSDGSVPKTRAADQGFKAETVTEIVGAGYRTASSIVAAWSKASSAKNTIFSKTANVMGPGYTFDKTRKYVHFWAVDFSTGKCGTGAGTSGPTAESSGSVESSDASGSVEAPAPASGSGDDTPAVTPAPAGSGAETPASGSGAAPASESGDDSAPASGSGADTPAAPAAPAAPGAPAGAPAAGTPATPAAPAATPAPGAPAGTPAAGTPATPAAPAAPAATPAPGAPAGTPAAGTPAAPAAPAATPAPAAEE